MTLWQIGQEISRQPASIFLRDTQGRRPVCGDPNKFQTDPYWRDYIFFHECFHGDYRAGRRANHQVGWTSLVDRILQIYGAVTDFEATVADIIAH